MTDSENEIYCKDCGACGVDGCCPSWLCQHSKDCLYPEYDNGLLTRFCRWLQNATNRKVANWVYDNVMNFPYLLNEWFVCSIFGHRYDSTYFTSCTRCYSIKPNRAGK